jgi:CBS domain-containing protein
VALTLLKLGWVIKVKEQNLATKATEIMSSPVHSLGADWPLVDAIRFFLDHKFSGAPVVDPDGKAIGVLTIKDVARYTEWHLEAEDADEDEAVGMSSAQADEKELAACYHIDRLTGTTVRQVMTPGIKTLPVDATICDVLDLMLKEHHHRVFISSRSGNIKGVISTLDIVKWLRESKCR